MKAVCNVINTTANTAARGRACQSARRKMDAADVLIQGSYRFRHMARSEPTDKTESNDNLLQAAFHIKWVIYVNRTSNKCVQYSISHFSHFMQS